MRHYRLIRFSRIGVIVFSLFVTGSIAQANVFDMPAGLTSVQFVTVGNPGNAADTRYGLNLGSVGRNYQMGKYEITAGQYTEFLNAVAKSDPNGLFDVYMSAPLDFPLGNLGANIQRSGASPNYSYSISAVYANRPVNWVSFWDAARFANWLQNGQPTGPQGPATTESGAYHDVGNQALFGRNADAKFFIPTKDEWYKAAYHNKSAGLAASYFDYPMRTNSAPGINVNETSNPGHNANYFTSFYVIGSPFYRTNVGEFELSASPYGTFDQGGNIGEWNETILYANYRSVSGSSFDEQLSFMHASSMYYYDPAYETTDVGFRVASLVPEPGSIMLFIVGAAALMVWRRVRR